MSKIESVEFWPQGSSNRLAKEWLNRYGDGWLTVLDYFNAADHEHYDRSTASRSFRRVAEHVSCISSGRNSAMTSAISVGPSLGGLATGLIKVRLQPVVDCYESGGFRYLGAVVQKLTHFALYDDPLWDSQGVYLGTATEEYT